MSLLIARALRKSYGRTPALRGASLALGPGEILAVTGASGSGKSTLLHCLAGILTPDEGTVLFAGDRLDSLDESRRSALRRSDFGIVFQFGQLIPELTALDNVSLPLLLAGASRGDARAAAGEWLERFGVRGQGELRPGEMSGGQAQRVATARALVTGPRIVFADEPTGALDSLAGEQVMTALVHAARESGAAVVLVTHDARVAAYADREVRVVDGLVEGDATGPSDASVSASVAVEARRES
ncbi:ABC transporter ATP-binding protein [Streptomyces sp. NPDC060194]|uniref:ABC transporter ATP-binding protein n=1 Tax=Streptomyces sp. NPDC060194 TaxID=3347069 RepID=UPI00364AB28E